VVPLGPPGAGERRQGFVLKYRGTMGVALPTGRGAIYSGCDR
jgi:hypothetical protein